MGWCRYISISKLSLVLTYNGKYSLSDTYNEDTVNSTSIVCVIVVVYCTHIRIIMYDLEINEFYFALGMQ